MRTEIVISSRVQLCCDDTNTTTLNMSCRSCW